MRMAAAMALGTLGVGLAHLLTRFLGRRLEDEYVEYPHGPTTRLDWLPIRPILSRKTLPAAASFTVRKADIILGTLLSYWRIGIHEFPKANSQYIDKFVRGEDAMYWHWLPPYETKNQSLWCGAFATIGFGAAGLKRDIRQKALASTARVQEWLDGTGRYKGDPHKDRRVFARNSKHTYGRLEDIRPGDLVVVGKGDKSAGNHIATALATPFDLDKKTLSDIIPRDVLAAVPKAVWGKFLARRGLLLIEGNASGYGPDGKKYEGVVVQFRPTIENREKPKQQAIMHAVRFKPEDYAT